MIFHCSHIEIQRNVHTEILSSEKIHEINFFFFWWLQSVSALKVNRQDGTYNTSNLLREWKKSYWKVFKILKDPLMLVRREAAGNPIIRISVSTLCNLFMLRKLFDSKCGIYDSYQNRKVFKISGMTRFCPHLYYTLYCTYLYYIPFRF